MARVLIVDDRDGWRLQVALMAGGYDHRIVTTVDDAAEAIESFRPDMVLLDHAIHRGAVAFHLIDGRPAIVCSAADSILDRVSCLAMGADDFISKPFDELELLERVSTVFRRWHVQQAAASRTIRFGALFIDKAQAQVTLGDQAVHLTPTEFRILVELANSAGSLVRTDDIGRAVWGARYNDNRLVHVQLGRLRTKLWAISDHPQIDTVWATGYRLID
jgi:DNA-binding response OmpR family regulator